MNFRSSRPSRFNGQLALGLPAGLFLMSTLGMLVHELGHGLTATLLGGEFTGWYLAPAVVGYAWYQLPADPVLAPALVRSLVTAGGAFWAILFWSVVGMIAHYELYRRENFWLSLLALGSVWGISSDLVYLGLGPFIQWGDGYKLYQTFSFWAPLVCWLLLILFLLFSGAQWLARALRPYVNLDSWPRVWAILVVTLIPQALYGTFKAALFFPEHSQRKLLYLGVLLGLLIPAAVGAWPLTRRILSEPGVRPAHVSEWTVLGLVLLVVAVEFAATWFFGLG